MLFGIYSFRGGETSNSSTMNQTNSSNSIPSNMPMVSPFERQPQQPVQEQQSGMPLSVPNACGDTYLCRTTISLRCSRKPVFYLKECCIRMRSFGSALSRSTQKVRRSVCTKFTISGMGRMMLYYVNLTNQQLTGFRTFVPATSCIPVVFFLVFIEQHSPCNCNLLEPSSNHGVRCSSWSTLRALALTPTLLYCK